MPRPPPPEKPWRKRAKRAPRRRAGEPPLPAPLRLVGGTDAGDELAPAVWRDPLGARRVLREVAALCPERIVVVSLAGNKLEVFSNVEDDERIIGMLHRASAKVADVAEANEPDDDPDDGA